MSFYRDPSQTQAEAVRVLVESTISVAMDVAAGRASDPSTFPIIPSSGVSEWLARRLLGDLVDAGFTPDGWESAYLAPSATPWPDPWARQDGGI